MSKQKPLLSILIPTKSRAFYAIHTIQSILANPDTGFELIVSDNGDNEDLERLVTTEIQDSRLKYRHVCEPKDVAENFVLATEQATGEYLCYLGDDDGVNPEIMDVIRWARTQSVEAITSTYAARYWWPDVRFRYYGGIFSGTIELSGFSGRIMYPNQRLEIVRCLSRAGASHGHLTRAYHGAVKRSCLEQMKKLAGQYFPGPSPDMSSAIALSYIINKSCVMDYPIFVPGASGGSIAGLGARKMHLGKLEDWPHLPKWSVQKWSRLVPRLFSGPSIWGEDVVQALTAIGRSDMLRYFNCAKVHALCFLNYPSQYTNIMTNLRDALKSQGASISIGRIKFVLACIWGYEQRAESFMNRIAIAAGCKSTVRKAGNIDQAISELSSMLRSRRKSIAAILKNENS